MADNKPSNRERIKEIVTGIEANIQDLFQSDKFADYLRTMSRFHSYSYNNTILIHMQMPSATHVAGFNKWKNQFGRHVKKGEKGLTIIAPTPFKKRIEEMKLDPDTRAPVLDHDGNVIMEEREIEIPLFRPVKVFDVSQTEGRPLPSLVAPLTGDVQQYTGYFGCQLPAVFTASAPGHQLYIVDDYQAQIVQLAALGMYICHRKRRVVVNIDGSGTRAFVLSWWRKCEKPSGHLLPGHLH